MADVVVPIFSGGTLRPAAPGDRLVYSDGSPVTGGMKATNRALLGTTGNIADLAAGAPDTVDGVTVQVGDRILVKDQTSAVLNGIYVVDTVGTGSNGAWSRAADLDEDVELDALILVQVTGGTENNDTLWSLDSVGGLTVGVSNLNFIKESRNRDRTSYSETFYLDGQNQLTNAVVYRIPIGRAGYLVEASVLVHDARTAGTLTMTLQKNGVALGSSALDLQIDGTDTQKDVETAAFNTTGLDVASGDDISVVITTTGFTPLVTCANFGFVVEHEF